MIPTERAREEYRRLRGDVDPVADVPPLPPPPDDDDAPPGDAEARPDLRLAINQSETPPSMADDPQGVIDTRGIEPVDLRALMTSEPFEVKWFAEPVLPAGKLVGIVAKRGEGKSLLLLDLFAAKASGRSVLGQPSVDPPEHVVYLDMEMGPDDLYDRLTDLGYSSDDTDFDVLVEHLHYYQLPALPPLDTEAGGEALEQIVDHHAASAVAIDTVSRVVSGAENDAEPYRDLFRHTETRLKRRRVTLARLDHFGKDISKGSRGHSAKEDPLDVVWELRVPDKYHRALKRTKGRQDGTPEEVWMNFQVRNGVVAHELPSEPIAPWLVEYAAELGRLNVPTGATVTETQKALKDAGIGKGRAAVCELVKYRRNAVPKRPEPHSGTDAQNRPEPHPSLIAETTEKRARTTTNGTSAVPETPGTTENRPVPGSPPPREGTEGPSGDFPTPF